MGLTGVAPTAPGAAVSPAAALRAAFHVNAIMMNSFQRYWSIFVKPFGCRTHPISRQSFKAFLYMDPVLSSPGWLLPPLTDCFIARPGLPRSHRAPPGSAQRPPAAGYFVFKVRGVFSIDGLILSLALFCSVIFTERSSALKEPYYPQRNQILPQEETFAFNCRICSSRFPKTPKPSAYPSSPSQKPQNF